jgi:hypothetical protein
MYLLNYTQSNSHHHHHHGEMECDFADLPSPLQVAWVVSQGSRSKDCGSPTLAPNKSPSLPHQNHAEDPTEDPTVGTIADPV